MVAGYRPMLLREFEKLNTGDLDNGAVVDEIAAALRNRESLRLAVEQFRADLLILRSNAERSRHSECDSFDTEASCLSQVLDLLDTLRREQGMVAI